MGRPKELSEEHLKMLNDRLHRIPLDINDVYAYISTLEKQTGYIDTLEAQVSTLTKALQRCQEANRNGEGSRS